MTRATVQRGRTKKRQPNRGSFRRGPDPRRHVFTAEERSRGGHTTAKRYLCTGRWHLNWWDRCSAKVRTEEGEFVDGEETDTPW